jgi:hypothetical protein
MLYRTVYTHRIVIEGNFKLAHVKQSHLEDDVWLADGQGMVTEQGRYKEHIITAVEERDVSTIMVISWVMLMMACRNAPVVHIVPYWISRWIMVDVILLGVGLQPVHVMAPLHHALLRIFKRVNGTFG